MHLHTSSTNSFIHPALADCCQSRRTPAPSGRPGTPAVKHSRFRTRRPTSAIGLLPCFSWLLRAQMPTRVNGTVKPSHAIPRRPSAPRRSFLTRGMGLVVAAAAAAVGSKRGTPRHRPDNPHNPIAATCTSRPEDREAHAQEDGHFFAHNATLTQLRPALCSECSSTTAGSKTTIRPACPRRSSTRSPARWSALEIVAAFCCLGRRCTRTRGCSDPLDKSVGRPRRTGSALGGSEKRRNSKWACRRRRYAKFGRKFSAVAGAFTAFRLSEQRNRPKAAGDCGILSGDAPLIDQLLAASSKYGPHDYRVRRAVMYARTLCIRPDPSGSLALPSPDPSRDWAIQAISEMCDGLDALQIDQSVPMAGEPESLLSINRSRGPTEALAAAEGMMANEADPVLVGEAALFAWKQGRAPSPASMGVNPNSVGQLRSCGQSQTARSWRCATQSRGRGPNSVQHWHSAFGLGVPGVQPSVKR